MANTTPLLCNKLILYQFKASFSVLGPESVVEIDVLHARLMALEPDTFYILDGLDANPLSSECLTLFISSPRSASFKDWCYHAMVTPWYFPVWSLDELRDCRQLCYPSVDPTTLSKRYEQYGGVARYVFWSENAPPSLEATMADTNARRDIRYVSEPSQIFQSSHMLLHLAVSEEMRFSHLVLASRYVGVLLFSKFYQETYEKLTSFLGSGGALAGHLFECYVHFIFENGRDEALKCRSLEGLHTFLHVTYLKLQLSHLH
jgi:hypothetical protein